MRTPLALLDGGPMSIISNFWQNMLEKYLPIGYNSKTERDTVRCPTHPLQKDFTMLSNFDTNKTEAKIQGLSVQVGELFADLYKNGSADESETALEAYKSLRRLLPTEFASDRHIGATAAHKATQGAS